MVTAITYSQITWVLFLFLFLFLSISFFLLLFTDIYLQRYMDVGISVEVLLGGVGALVSLFFI